MNTSTGSPHDRLAYSTFCNPIHAAAWLQDCLGPDRAAHFDWPTLRLVAARLQGRGLRFGLADFVFEVRLLHRNRLVRIVVEHRSFLDLGLHDTLLRYAVHLAHVTRRNRNEAPMPLVVIVLFHGPGEPFLQPRVLADLDAVHRDLLGPLQPRLQALLDNLTASTEAQIRARPLSPLGTLTLLALRFLPHLDAAATVAALDRWGALLRAVDRDEHGPPIGEDAIEAFGWYLLHVNETPAEDVHMALERNLQRPEEKIMSTAERLKMQGRAEGKAEGRAETLLRQLQRRFAPLPPSIEPRLRSASLVELDRWADRILDATTLDAVFATT